MITFPGVKDFSHSFLWYERVHLKRFPPIPLCVRLYSKTSWSDLSMALNKCYQNRSFQRGLLRNEYSICYHEFPHIFKPSATAFSHHYLNLVLSVDLSAKWHFKPIQWFVFNHRPPREENIPLYIPCTWCKNCYEWETDVTDERRRRMWGMPTHPPAPLTACVDFPLITRRLHGKV